MFFRRFHWLIVIGAIVLVGCAGSKGGQQAASSTDMLAKSPQSSPSRGPQATSASDPFAESSQPPLGREEQTGFSDEGFPSASDSFFDPQAVVLGLEEVAHGLRLPVAVTHAGDGSNRLFVIEKYGTIRRLPEGDLFLDISDRVKTGGIDEQGLLGLVFHPRVQENGYFYVYYTNADDDTVLSRFRLTADRQSGDPDSEQIILQQEKATVFHNGGMLAFGPDGFLYISVGDDTGPANPSTNAQNRQSWLGKILRIDVDRGDPYAIPPDNPFVDDPTTLPEIWAYGLRNPWRFSFDRLTGDMYIASVGQNRYESVYFQPAGSQGGANYGWPIVEGSHCVHDEGCDKTGLTLPVTEYYHSLGCSIIGGSVYRGERYPWLQGAYIFSDHCSGRLWALARDPEGRWVTTEMLQADLPLLSSLGEDESGEIYVVDMGPGTIYRLTAQQRTIDRVPSK